MTIFDEDTLMMLFDECGVDFGEWAANSNYNSSMSDEQIYALLPDDIKAYCSDLVMNTSWYHGGM